MKLTRALFIIFFCTITQLCANSSSLFSIPFPEKENLSHEDYVEIQKQLSSIHIDGIIKDYYPQDQGYTTEGDFLRRCSRGIRQNLIDLEKGLVPIQKLEKIGNGGKNCIVCCVAYQKIYPDLLKALPTALKNTGFNGYLLYQIGGFPNPTGKEIKYAGVPYSFKIFMMLEAQKQGFDNVLWIDSAMLPLRDPTPLFDWIQEHQILLHGWKPIPITKKYLLPKTHELLRNLTGTDVLKAPYVCTSVFGMKMNDPQVQNLIKDYYAFCELGTPFLSCYPEEFVLTALIGKGVNKNWSLSPIKNLVKQDGTKKFEYQKIAKARQKNYFFFHQKH